LEDLGEHRSLVEPLLHGSATDAETGLLKYYTSLGSLHAMTAGKADQFDAMFSAKFPGQPFAVEIHELAERMQKVQKLLDQLGVKSDRHLLGEIDAVTKSMLQPGPFLAYIHSDPCPDNLFDRGDRYRFIDFEWGHFGNALLDAVYPRMLWPSCWCANRLPEALIIKLEDVYRAELISGCPQAQEDDIWETALIHMCAMTMINRWGWDLELALNEDRKRGMATVRQKTLAQLEAFIQISEKFQRLAVLYEVAIQIHTLLQTRWTETHDLPLYPAFENVA
jgi:Ser/Thr protein kinase RdoA (MazF antagonist)